MEHTAAMDKDFGITFPPDFLELFPPGTKIVLALEGESIRVTRAAGDIAPDSDF
jgi:hypothetical protein